MTLVRQVHPAADKWPLLPADELQALAESPGVAEHLHLAPQLADGQEATHCEIIDGGAIVWKVSQADGVTHVSRFAAREGVAIDTRRPIYPPGVGAYLHYLGMNARPDWRIAETQAPRAAPTSSVYFIREHPDGFIKIGVARDAAGRMKSLQTASARDLRLLGTIPGGRDVELRLHERFAGERVRGEWFKPSPRLLAYISRVTT